MKPEKQNIEAQGEGHSYDGIVEYDNPSPPWWNYIFVTTVVFSVGYWAYFHMGLEGRGLRDQFSAAMGRYYKAKYSTLGDIQPTRETLVTLMNQEEWVSVGKSIFNANCTNCHGPQGQGNQGANLTDDNWKNVRTIEDIAKVISDGAANGSMPAWKTKMGDPRDIIMVSAYVASLRKNPVEGRAPEGNVIPPWPTLEEVGSANK